MTVDDAAAPLHGYRGDAPDEGAAQPRGLTVALSREAGARGTTIAHKLGDILGWQVFDQEMIDYLIVNDAGRARSWRNSPTAGGRGSKHGTASWSVNAV